jgi:hypothetical protein
VLHELCVNHRGAWGRLFFSFDRALASAAGRDVQVLGVVFVKALGLDLNRGKIEAKPVAQQVVRFYQERCSAIGFVYAQMRREDVLVRGNMW